eukprot:gene3159-3689_t
MGGTPVVSVGACMDPDEYARDFGPESAAEVATADGVLDDMSDDSAYRAAIGERRAAADSDASFRCLVATCPSTSDDAWRGCQAPHPSKGNPLLCDSICVWLLRDDADGNDEATAEEREVIFGGNDGAPGPANAPAPPLAHRVVLSLMAHSALPLFGTGPAPPPAPAPAPPPVLRGEDPEDDDVKCEPGHRPARLPSLLALWLSPLLAISWHAQTLPAPPPLRFLASSASPPATVADPSPRPDTSSTLSGLPRLRHRHGSQVLDDDESAEEDAMVAALYRDVASLRSQLQQQADHSRRSRFPGLGPRPSVLDLNSDGADPDHLGMDTDMLSTGM